jgi:CheY-like chemotaxis protein
MTKTVLVIDDDQQIRESLEDVLRDEGYTVFGASNGREALALLARLERPCAIVLDLIMPVMNGREFYEAMCRDERFAAIPVVVSTSDPSRSPAGLITLKKPLDISRLLVTVKTFFPDPAAGGNGGGREAPALVPLSSSDADDDRSGKKRARPTSAEKPSVRLTSAP